jgi:hypothetical protein
VKDCQPCSPPCSLAAYINEDGRECRRWVAESVNLEEAPSRVFGPPPSFPDSGFVVNSRCGVLFQPAVLADQHTHAQGRSRAASAAGAGEEAG